jgi:hypothetical protein
MPLILTLMAHLNRLQSSPTVTALPHLSLPTPIKAEVLPFTPKNIQLVVFSLLLPLLLLTPMESRPLSLHTTAPVNQFYTPLLKQFKPLGKSPLQPLLQPKLVL